MAARSSKIKIGGCPNNGEEAYQMVVWQLHREIADRQKILTELSDPIVRRTIIKQWTPKKENVCITVVDR